ncbi:MAG: winged helix-turn-helix transcriptional regulator [Infirmifilum sp.]
MPSMWGTSEGEDLDDIDRKIYEVIRELGETSLNNLARKVKDIVSRPTLRNRLDKLERLGLITRERGRRGQRMIIRAVELPFYRTSREMLAKSKELVKEIIDLCMERMETAEVKEYCEKAVRESIGFFLEASIAFILQGSKEIPEGLKKALCLEALEAIREIFDHMLSKNVLGELLRLKITYGELKEAYERIEETYNELRKRAGLAENEVPKDSR